MFGIERDFSESFNRPKFPVLQLANRLLLQLQCFRDRDWIDAGGDRAERGSCGDFFELGDSCGSTRRVGSAFGGGEITCLDLHL